MRGDSLRDLYAKTIAVFGLGLLAGVGALVDYWPTGVELVRVNSAFPEPVLAGALPLPDDVQALAPPVRVARAAVPNRPVRSVPSLQVMALNDVAIGFTVAMAAPPASLPSPEPGFTAAGRPVALRLSEPAAPMTLALAGDPLVAELEVATDFGAEAALDQQADLDDDGLITRTFKRTGSSIASAGAMAGASIVGAVRTVTGVVRRVNPFN